MRSRLRRRNRRLDRYASRMLGGARRSPPPNYLAIASQALLEAIRIRKRAALDFQADRELLAEYERELWVERELRPLLDRVYGSEQPDQSVPTLANAQKR